MKPFVTVCLFCAVAFAGTGKIRDVAPYSEHGAPQVTVIQGYPNPIVTQGKWDMFAITVELDGMAYTANFRAKRNFHAADFVVGTPIEASIDGKHLVISRPDGKTEKAVIVKKQLLEP